MIIKNYNELISDEIDADQIQLRKIALNCLEIAIKSVKPKEMINRAISLNNRLLRIQENVYDLAKVENIYIVGGGKATFDMAVALENILNSSKLNLSYKGFINIPDNQKIDKEKLSSNFKINQARHPIPNKKGINGVKKILKLLKGASKNDLIIILISGGGSSILPYPKKDIKLQDLINVTSLLLGCGASIHEVNTIRKHLSDIKGGNFARWVQEKTGATLISLIISDVVGDNLDSIASGPTVPDTTTYEDAWKIIVKYGLTKKIPKSIKSLINRGRRDKKLETLKPGNPIFHNVHNYLIGSVKDAADNILKNLKELDFIVEYFSNQVSGEAKHYSDAFLNLLNEQLKIENPGKFGFIGTGELTVTIGGDGIGGRNQEFLLTCLKKLKEIDIEDIKSDFLLMGANLDGIEGNSKAIGALIDNFTLKIVKNKNINLESYLKRNDSNTFFKLVNSEIITGVTGCNVNDIILALVLKKS
ncbi:MAG: DUF4147 domain-containing protein [Candidatus Lokiarchaeota archaeon]